MVLLTKPKLYRIIKAFWEKKPKDDFISIHIIRTSSQYTSLRQGSFLPTLNLEEEGALITVHSKGGAGYWATPSLSLSSLWQAYEKAKKRATELAPFTLIDFSKITFPTHQYTPPTPTPTSKLSYMEKIDLLQSLNSCLKSHNTIVDWGASLWEIEEERIYTTNQGSYIEQSFSFFLPYLYATAAEKEAQRRTFGFNQACYQGGKELLEKIDLKTISQSVSEEALLLIQAPPCPEMITDVVIAPDQMVLQIHESIAHPLELDRILGDERNYAGSSFVTLDMFGHYRYGSELLNVTFDPFTPHALASYKFDDEGMEAQKVKIIEKGILLRPLGGTISQYRAQIQGTASSRTENWNRPPIDRISNINLEPGDKSFEEIISSIEKGLYLKTNRSWSIDDRRNKFQFGCEWGQLIEEGKLTKVVKNPNYRGISSHFWRNLKAVGNNHTKEICGSPFCGKGEPNQIIRVGHASPVCHFTNVEVFGTSK